MQPVTPRGSLLACCCGLPPLTHFLITVRKRSLCLKVGGVNPGVPCLSEGTRFRACCLLSVWRRQTTSSHNEFCHRRRGPRGAFVAKQLLSLLLALDAGRQRLLCSRLSSYLLGEISPGIRKNIAKEIDANSLPPSPSRLCPSLFPFTFLRASQQPILLPLQPIALGLRGSGGEFCAVPGVKGSRSETGRSPSQALPPTRPRN